jgi:hypothetical protein
MRKCIFILVTNLVTVFILSISSYALWTEYADVRFLDLDGDFVEEIIIESHHGAGSGHYVEMLRIFKEDDKSAGLKLIFMATTLDSIFGYGPGNDDISEVTFTGPETGGGLRDIIVKSKKIYYKDDENKVVDREEDLGTKIYKWNGEVFVEATS